MGLAARSDGRPQEEDGVLKLGHGEKATWDRSSWLVAHCSAWGKQTELVKERMVTRERKTCQVSR